jgi:hypothetical protein
LADEAQGFKNNSFWFNFWKNARRTGAILLQSEVFLSLTNLFVHGQDTRYTLHCTAPP